MDFKKFVKTAKTKTKQYSDKAVDFSSKKLSESKLTLKTAEELQKLIDSSQNTKFTNKET
ncbi:MAG: hypothetical protein ACPHY8_04820 [Patescibacteria group bacterium]